ncbi:MAG: hypothetical protein FJY10_05925 [Bacteroidetes bacterium]|nr:hypothetical protein [Bacteroidota bacterium]
MLINEFYKIDHVSKLPVKEGDDSPHFEVRVTINRDHPIFKGHFPGNPVVPGVCQVEMVRETLEHILASKLTLIQSDNIKFLNMISPLTYTTLTIEHRLKHAENNIVAHSQIQSGETVFLKMKAVFSEQQSANSKQ